MARAAGDVTDAAIVPGEVLRDLVIPAREYAAFTMYATNVLRIVDLEGKQVADTIAFNLHNLAEKMNNENTMLVNHTYNPTEGHVVYSDDCNPMFTILRDTVGRNYPGGAMCSEELNRTRYGVPGTRNCRDNLADAVAPWGIGKRDLPGAFTPFMNVVHYPDGSAEIAEPTSEPGSYIDLRAEMHLLVAISACPQERNPCNGFHPTSLRTIVYHPTQ
jgi:uncharacterized protein YcgI (DUF1989 family)